jgi:hypothetical protein
MIENLQIVDEIFNDAWNNTSILPISRELVLNYLPQLEEINFQELLLYCCQNFSEGESIGFLMCVPELWKQWNLDDWIEFSIKLQPRQQFNLFEPNGFYTDLIFFHRFLDLNFIKKLHRDNSLSQESWNEIIRFCQINSSNLIPDPSDLDDLDNVVMCHISVLQEYRNKLLMTDPELLPNNYDDFCQGREVGWANAHNQPFSEQK